MGYVLQKEKTAAEPENGILRQAAQVSDTSNRTGIPGRLKEQFEASSGLSFDDVRIHYHSAAPARLRALAFTRGNQVYVGPGQERHLGHELGHVVQQKQGRVRPTTHIGTAKVNDSRELEAQADRLYDRARQTDASSSQLKHRDSEAGDNLGSGHYSANVVQRVPGNAGGYLINHPVHGQVSVYRGGQNFTAHPNEVRFVQTPALRSHLTPPQAETDILRTTHGISLNIDAQAPVIQAHGAVRIETIPGTLRIIQRGVNPLHYEAVPNQGQELTFHQYNLELGLITHTP